jgi:preprotein translocase SecE subunit
VARQTRSQRRARRQAQGVSSVSSAGAPPRRRTPADDGGGGGEPEGIRPTPHGPERAPRTEPERKTGVVNFIRECWAELMKVEWPGQSQIVQGVTVVLIACIVVGTYLFAADQVFKRFVQTVLLGQ